MRNNRLFFIFLILTTSLFSFNLAYAKFTSAASNTGNTFIASSSFPSPSVSASSSPSPTPCPNSGTHVVINEIFYDVPASHQGTLTEAQAEWVELYNPTSSSIALTGWKIGSDTTFNTFSGIINLAPCSFAIISETTQANFVDPSKGNWTLPVGTTYIQISNPISPSGLSNTGDNVILQNNSSAEIDAMSYGTDTSKLNPAALDVASGHSLERNPSGKDTGVASDFVDRITPTPGL